MTAELILSNTTKSKKPGHGLFLFEQESLYNLVYALGLAKNH